MGLKQKTFFKWIRCYCYNNEFILLIKRHIKNNILSNIVLFIFSPYLLMRWGVSELYEKLYAIKHINKLNFIDKNKIFKYELGIVCIAKNEAPYLKEWISYHKLIGVNKIYFYDNESTDNTCEILKSYINEGYVEYYKIVGYGKQLDAYNDAINKYKNDCRYMAFLDLDEYIFITSELQKNISDLITNLLDRAGGGASGIGVNWCLFGSAGLEKRPNGLIIENYIYRGYQNHWGNFHIKTICNPRRIKKFISPHYPLYMLGAYNINESNLERTYGWFSHYVQWENIRLNHYYCKSKEDYLIKVSRGLGDRKGEYDLSQFNDYDLNDVKDESILKYSNFLNI